MNILKKIFILSLSALIMLCFCGCQSIVNQVNTDIDFNRDDVFLLTEKYLAAKKDESIELYTADNKMGDTALYDTIEGSFSISDFKGNSLLLRNAESLISYSLDTKENVSFYESVFSEEEKQGVFKFQSFFVGDANTLAVTKVILDTGKPIFTADVKTGYSVSDESGIYLYDLSANQCTLKGAVTLDDLGTVIAENEEITFTCAETADGAVSVSLRIYPATIPFYRELFYKINPADLSFVKIGESGMEESQDIALQYSYLENRLIKADSNQVICVDFENKKLNRFEFGDIADATGVDILETGDKSFFFVNVGTANGDLLYKFKLNSGVLNCEVGNSEMLSSENLIQNSFARGNKLYFPSDEEARKYGTLFVNGTAYRSYSQNGYLCDNDGKTVIIFE